MTHDQHDLDVLARAIAIAAEIHGRQRDENGDPRILRVLRAMMMADGEVAQTRIVVSDILASSKDWTLERLRGEGFGDDVLGGDGKAGRRKDGK
jgi:hypothetical protein